MNIISHLNHQVTSIIHLADDSQNEIALLDKFYSILLARMTDKEAYDKLSKDGKMSSKKLTLYKLLNNISWKEDDSSKQIIPKLAENHDIAEDKVKVLLREATPLVFAEIRTLAGDQQLPDYLQKLLNEPTSSFSHYIPNWALTDILPTGLISQDILTATEKEALATTAHTDAEITSSKSVDGAKTDKTDTEVGASDSAVRSLPNPVHADAREYSYENITTGEASGNSTDKSTNSDSSAKLLPIIGLIVLAVILWALLRGCQSTHESEVATTKDITLTQKTTASTDAITDDAVTGDKDGKVKTEDKTADNKIKSSTTSSNKAQSSKKSATKIADSKVKEGEEPAQTLIIISTNELGKLAHAQVSTGTGKSAEQLKTTLNDVFGNVTAENSQIKVEAKRNDDIAVADKLPQLMALIKNKKNTSIHIEGNNIRFMTTDKAEQQALVLQAQEILSGFKVSASTEDIPKPVESSKVKSAQPQGTNTDKTKAKDGDHNQQTTNQQTTNGKIVKLPENDLAVVRLEAVNDITKHADQPSIKQSTAVDNTSVNGKNNAKVNVKEEVAKSISASKKALDSLNNPTGIKDADIKAVEQALNMQIINFAVNDNKIPKENQAILNQAAKLLKSMDAQIVIIGHTDADGEADYNKRLSEDRSFAVKKYLMKQGLTSKQMKAEGLGESNPIADNNTEAGKFRNRRIEFKIYKNKAKTSKP